MAHIGLNRIQTEMIDHLAQFLDALFIGGQLGAQIGQVLIRVAGGIFCAQQDLAEVFFPIAALIDQFEIVDQHTFFVDML